MDDIKPAAAKMHREVTKHCAPGNSEKAERLATAAAEAATVANRHAVEALALYRHHTEEMAERKVEEDAEEAARAAKHAAKVADAG